MKDTRTKRERNVDSALFLLDLLAYQDNCAEEINKQIAALDDDNCSNFSPISNKLTYSVLNLIDNILEYIESTDGLQGVAASWFYDWRKSDRGGEAEIYDDEGEVVKTYKIKTIQDIKDYVMAEYP